MEFGEFMGMLVALVLFPAVLFNGIAKIRRARAGQATPSGEALKVSELKAMIQEAVAAETTPLRERIEWLEAMEAARTDDVRLLSAAPSAPLLALDDDARPPEAQPALRSRTSA